MDCVLLEVELAVELLSTLQEQEPTEPAVGIVLGWELPGGGEWIGNAPLLFGAGAGGAYPVVRDDLMGRAP